MECSVGGKIFRQVATHWRLIIALVYPWYTNSKHDERKDKINSIIQESECSIIKEKMFCILSVISLFTAK